MSAISIRNDFFMKFNHSRLVGWLFVLFGVFSTLSVFTGQLSLSLASLMVVTGIGVLKGKRIWGHLFSCYIAIAGSFYMIICLLLYVGRVLQLTATLEVVNFYIWRFPVTINFVTNPLVLLFVLLFFLYSYYITESLYESG